jgi:hypothetical protein
MKRKRKRKRKRRRGGEGSLQSITAWSIAGKECELKRSEEQREERKREPEALGRENKYTPHPQSLTS